jgi:hypothetical protein
LRSSLASLRYRTHSLLRICSRISLQFATGTRRVDVGPSVQFRDGHYQANTRTHARAEGIEKFLSSHSWADSLDLHTYLEGFDAGEEYGRADDCHRQDSPR